MSAFESLILGLYFFVLVILGVYGWHRYYLVYAYMKNKDKVPGPPPAWDGPLPPVTIQLPIFNEMYVVDRLLQATARIDYPRELMEIQVLDDGGSMYTKLEPGQYHGSIYKVVAAKRGFQKPVGQWNSEEITANGRQITIKLNGTTIVDANLDDVKDEAVLKQHRDLTKPEGSRGIANTTGHIGFLGHGAHVEFRNIRIKVL